MTLLLQDGDTATAQRVMTRITRPIELVKLRLDAGFDFLFEGSADFDALLATEEILLVDRGRMQEFPDDAGAIELVFGDLLALGRHTEALGLVDWALARHKPVQDERNFDARNWLYDFRAQVLMDLGRFDEALEASRAGASRDESGNENISQRINLASLLNNLGKPEEALTVLAPFDIASPALSDFGRVAVAANRACALLQLGRDAAEPIAYVDQHGTAISGIRREVLLCANDIEGAAAEFVARLEDPGTRGEVLLALSTWRTAAQTPVMQEYSRRLDKVRAHPRVQATIATVGRLGTFDLYPGAR